ncbi:MAG: enoyl-CoA hydratase-related protein [Gammaproteobacteria bacterium]|nr:enoyl-CoA hydratase-related protein [Gammaproteobacteria bacterium]
MELKYVLTDTRDGIGTITINRPEIMNTISRRVYAELDQAFDTMEADEAVKVIIVTGAGEHFGAGHDIGSQGMRDELDEFPRDLSLKGRVEAMDRGVYFALHDKWRNLSKPTIAAIRGYCIMGSWMLAASCDLAIASETARFADRCRSLEWRPSRISHALLGTGHQESEGIPVDRRFHRG